jgi:phage I-like protein
LYCAQLALSLWCEKLSGNENMETIMIDNSSPQAKKFLAYARTLPFVKESGKEEEIKWTAKMKRAFAEKEFKVGDINNFWDEFGAKQVVVFYQ